MLLFYIGKRQHLYHQSLQLHEANLSAWTGWQIMLRFVSSYFQRIQFEACALSRDHLYLNLVLNHVISGYYCLLLLSLELSTEQKKRLETVHFPAVYQLHRHHVYFGFETKPQALQEVKTETSAFPLALDFIK